MHRNNRPHIPWSRHVEVSPDTTRGRISQGTLSERTRRLIKSRNAREGATGAIASTTRRRVQSESSLLNGGSVNHEEESWDSQSDPGSASQNDWKRFSSKSSLTGVEESNRSDPEGDGGVKTKAVRKVKPVVQGRGGHQQNVIRRRIRATDGNDEIAVEIPDQNGLVGENPGKHRHHVQTYLDFMHYVCLNPHKYDETKCLYTLKIIQKVIFCYIVLLATMSSVTLIKLVVLYFINERDLNNFIDIGYFIVSGTFQMYVTYTIAFRKGPISKCLTTWEKYERANRNGNLVGVRNKTEWLPIVNGVVTIVIAAWKTIALYDSLEEAVLESSATTAEGIFLWTTENMENQTDTLIQSYGTKLSATTYSMGIFRLLTVFCWNIQVDCCKDLIFWIAKLNEHHTLEFGRKIKANLEMKYGNRRTSDESDDDCWETYRQVIEVNMSVNATFFVVLMITHLDTFLTFSYLLTLILKEDISPALLIVTGYDVLKGIAPYFPARRASLENDRCRKWIQTLPCETKRFCVGNTAFTRDVMLWELKEEPLGLGSGKTHINNEFIVTFITVVASLFCFLLNLETKTDIKTRY